MSVTYTIDPARRLVLMRTEGQPPLDEWFARFDEAVADPRFGPGFAFVCDRTEASQIPDAVEARAWAGQFASRIKRLGGGRLAVVVGEPVVYGMVRMASAFAEAEGAAVAVFYSEAEALAWLARDPDSAAALSGP